MRRTILGNFDSALDAGRCTVFLLGLFVACAGKLAAASEPNNNENATPVRGDQVKSGSGNAERKPTDVTAQQIRDALLSSVAKLADLKIDVVERGDFVQRAPGIEAPVIFKQMWMHSGSSQAYLDFRYEGNGDEWWTGFKPIENPLTTKDLAVLPGLKQCADLSRVPSFADSRVLRQKAADGTTRTLHSLSKKPEYVFSVFVPLVEFNRPWIAPERINSAPLSDAIMRLPLAHWEILGEETLGDESVVTAAIRLQDTVTFPLKQHEGKLSLTPTYLVWFSKRFGWMPLRVEQTQRYTFAGQDYWIERRSDGKQMLVYQASDFAQLNGVWLPKTGKQTSYMQANNDSQPFAGFDSVVDRLLAHGKMPMPGEMEIGYEYEWKILSLEKIDPDLKLWFEPQDGAEVSNVDTKKRYIQGDAVATAVFTAREHAIERMIGKPAPEFPEGATWLNGQPLTLKSLQGKVVMLDFWSDSCGSCRNDLPRMNALHQQRETNGLTVIGVHLSGSQLPDIQKVVDEFKLDYPICIDVMAKEGTAEEFLFPSQFSSQFGVSSIPHCVVINQQGVVAASTDFGDSLKVAIELTKSPK